MTQKVLQHPYATEHQHLSLGKMPMPIDKLHYHAQNLKSLQQNLLKICDEDQQAMAIALK